MKTIKKVRNYSKTGRKCGRGVFSELSFVRTRNCTLLGIYLVVCHLIEQCERVCVPSGKLQFHSEDYPLPCK